MAFKFNPFTGTLDEVSTSGGGSTSPGGSTTQVQFNDAGAFAGDADLTWNKTTNVLGITGDVNLSDGGTYTTTLQTITPTAARTISFPNSTGTVGLVGGSSGNLVVNQSGAYVGVANSSVDNATGDITLGSRFISSLNGAASAPPGAFTGTWFTGGTATTTKPQVLIEPTGATSTAWSTAGTALGVNASSGFAGNLLDLQVNGSRRFSVSNTGTATSEGGGIATNSPSVPTDCFVARWGSAFPVFRVFVDGNGPIVTVASTGYYAWSDSSLSVGNADLRLFRDAANTLAQRNLTNAQTFRCYNTWTSSTNYELGKLEWSSNVFRIGTEKGSGGGTARAVEVHTDSIARLALDTTGSVRVVTALTVATLPGTPAVGMVARVTDATAPVVGTTVAGGGAAAALCWYNGASWSVIGV